jgi:hypothetical protein
VRFLIPLLGLLACLAGCGSVDWGATLESWAGAACRASDDCSRTCPGGRRPWGPAGNC